MEGCEGGCPGTKADSHTPGFLRRAGLRGSFPAGETLLQHRLPFHFRELNLRPGRGSQTHMCTCTQLPVHGQYPMIVSPLPTPRFTTSLVQTEASRALCCPAVSLLTGHSQGWSGPRSCRVCQSKGAPRKSRQLLNLRRRKCSDT